MSLELEDRIQREKNIEDNKHELITNISHDLKTPLTSIGGYLELLSRKNINEETRDEYIKIAYNKSLRLKSLVNELFEYTKLTSVLTPGPPKNTMLLLSFKIAVNCTISVFITKSSPLYLMFLLFHKLTEK